MGTAQQYFVEFFSTWRVVATVLLILGMGVVVAIVRSVAVRLLDSPVRAYKVGKAISRIGAIVLVSSLAIIWTPGQRELITLLTVIGAGLLISMREGVFSIACWFFIAFRNPYQVGDRIEVNGLKGDVVDIRLLHTVLMEVDGWAQGENSTGRLVSFPNLFNLLHPIYNHSAGFGFVWNEWKVVLTPDSDWMSVRDFLQEMADSVAEPIAAQAKTELHKLSRDYLVHYSTLTPFVFMSIEPKGIGLTLRYLCDVRKRRSTEHAFATELLNFLKAHPDVGKFAHA